jgi:hypothetical protein
MEVEGEEGGKEGFNFLDIINHSFSNFLSLLLSFPFLSLFLPLPSLTEPLNREEMAAIHVCTQDTVFAVLLNQRLLLRGLQEGGLADVAHQ